MPFFSRSKNHHRRDDADEIRTLAFEVDSLEFFSAGDDVGLLRLSGLWIAPVDRVLDAVSLVAAVNGHEVEVAPLPDPEGATPLATPAGEPWRAAFSMSSELAQSPVTELALVVRDGERIDLPRPGEFAANTVPPAADSASPPEMEIAEPMFHADADLAAEPAGDEVARLRAELHRLHTELEVERRRYAALEEELRSHASLETDLRNAMAMQEAEVAAAVTQAAQRARREERQRERATVAEQGDRSRQPIDPDLLDRIERARRAADAAA